MRIFYINTARPRKLAKKLKAILDISLSESQKHIACLSGYKDWNELLVVTNRKEVHSHPDVYEYPQKYLINIFNQNEEIASQLILFFKNNMQYPNLNFQIPSEIKEAIKTCNQNIIIGSDTGLPRFVYQNICEYISSIKKNNFILKNTVTQEIEIMSKTPYTLKIHASNLKELKIRYERLIKSPTTSLFIYLKIQDNKVQYDFESLDISDSDKGLKVETFNDAISNALRKDKDTIIIGKDELYNPETAKLAFDYAYKSFIQNMWSQSNSNIIVSKILELRNGNTESVWLNYTKIMLTALLNALVWLRDNAGYELTPKIVWDNIDKKQMELIINGEKYPELPLEYKDSIQKYFNELENIGTIDVYKSHGYIQHELINVFKEFGLRDWYL